MIIWQYVVLRCLPDLKVKSFHYYKMNLNARFSVLCLWCHFPCQHTLTLHGRKLDWAMSYRIEGEFKAKEVSLFKRTPILWFQLISGCELSQVTARLSRGNWKLLVCIHLYLHTYTSIIKLILYICIYFYYYISQVVNV